MKTNAFVNAEIYPLFVNYMIRARFQAPESQDKNGPGDAEEAQILRHIQQNTDKLHQNTHTRTGTQTIIHTYFHAMVVKVTLWGQWMFVSLS